MLKLYLLFLPLMSFATAALEPASEFDRIQKAGQLIVAVHAEDTPPFFYKKPNGEIAGIDIDLAKIAAQNLGVKPVFNRSIKSFNELIPFLLKGNVDVVLSALYPSLERLTQVSFTESYMDVQAVIVLNRAKAAGLKVRMDLLTTANRPEIIIGHYQSSALRELLPAALSEASFRTYRNREELLPDLQSGKITAAFTDELEITKWRKKISTFDLYFAVVPAGKQTFPVSAAIRWKDTHLVAWFNQLIQQLRSSGKLEAIIRSHVRGSLK